MLIPDVKRGIVHTWKIGQTPMIKVIRAKDELEKYSQEIHDYESDFTSSFESDYLIFNIRPLLWKKQIHILEDLQVNKPMIVVLTINNSIKTKDVKEITDTVSDILRMIAERTVCSKPLDNNIRFLIIDTNWDNIIKIDEATLSKLVVFKHP
jgi:hypothetical protein